MGKIGRVARREYGSLFGSPGHLHTFSPEEHVLPFSLEIPTSREPSVVNSLLESDNSHRQIVDLDMNTVKILCRTVNALWDNHCQKLLRICFSQIVSLLWHTAEQRAKLKSEH